MVYCLWVTYAGYDSEFLGVYSTHEKAHESIPPNDKDGVYTIDEEELDKPQIRDPT